MKREIPKQYAVYEREPQICKKPHGIVLSPYDTSNEAEDARIKFGYVSDNYYVAWLKD